MNRRLRALTAGLITGLLFSVVAPALPAHAVEGESITLSPTRLDLDVKAGETKSGKFTVINDGTVDYEFKVYGTPYSVKNRSYEPDFFNKTANSDAYTWLTFGQDSYQLKAGEKTEVPYTLEVPSDAAPGGHYGVIFAETQSDKTDDSQVIRKKRVGLIMYTTVDGDYIEQGKVESISIDFIQLGGGPLSSTITINNTGNTDFQAQSLLRVKNVLGNVVHERKIQHTIMPKTTRDIQLQWDRGPSFGLYNVTVENTVLGKTEVKQSWVLMLSAWALIVLLAILASLIFFVVRKFRR